MKMATTPKRTSSNNNYVRTYNFADFPVQFIDVNIRVIKIKAHSKEPAEAGWNKNANYSARNPEISNFVRNGGNYGVTSLFGFYCSIDADSTQIQDSLDSALPETYRWSTGKDGHFQYAYFLEDEPMGCVPLRDGAYIKGRGGYALGPGSIHPNGIMYGSREIRDIPIATVKKDELLRALRDFTIVESGKVTSYYTAPKDSARIDRDVIVKILTPYWGKADGRRNDFTLAIAGFNALKRIMEEIENDKE